MAWVVSSLGASLDATDRAIMMTHFAAGMFPNQLPQDGSMTDFRTERDSMGEVQVPTAAYYGCLLYTSDAADE